MNQTADIPNTEDTLLAKVTDFLMARFPGAYLRLDWCNPPKVYGYLVWDGFDDLSMSERHRMVWDTFGSRVQHEGA